MALGKSQRRESIYCQNKSDVNNFFPKPGISLGWCDDRPQDAAVSQAIHYYGKRWWREILYVTCNQHKYPAKVFTYYDYMVLPLTHVCPKHSKMPAYFGDIILTYVQELFGLKYICIYIYITFQGYVWRDDIQYTYKKRMKTFSILSNVVGSLL